MTISPAASRLVKPKGDGRIPEWMLRSARARRRQVYHSMVLAEFEKSGITQAELARRIGKSPRRVNQWLSNPSNWESDTVADLLFGTTGTVDVPFAVEPTHEAQLIDKVNAPQSSFKLVYFESDGRIAAPTPTAHEETHHVVVPRHQAPPSYA